MRGPPILRHRKINHIPYDIVLNIMKRLPVKSVMRLRCVSKSMDSLVTSHDFISTHLKNISKNHDHENGYVIHQPSWEITRPIARPLLDTSFCTVAFDSTFDRISEVRIPFHINYTSAKIVGSCNGLLCLAIFEDRVIYLWNPCIRKFKRLPDTCLRRLESARLRFAYDSKNDDYKVVRI